MDPGINYWHQYVLINTGRVETPAAAPICFISIEFSMSANELIDTIQNNRPIDQAKITGVYTNKDKGCIMAKTEENIEYTQHAHPISLEKIFPEFHQFKNHLNEYQSHLEKRSESGSRNRKLEIVKQIQNIMNDANVMQQDKILAINDFLQKPSEHGNTNKELLSEWRDPMALHILALIGHALTFGLVSKFTKGTFAFWKAQGEVLSDEVAEISQKKPTIS